ncbi:hypothetical protein HUJ04_007908 [Dendroctonus ponderosae]|nr:hypothetical protein HUJ04_007908 [Dendroctonus ponderosae]KAH1026117.1 hypothetical protein HUJ05_010689 [Dendroctonus ponderosae]
MSHVSPLLFLLKLAWDCRYRLPLLITVGFMVLDVRMQLDINVQMREIPRPRHHLNRPTRVFAPDPTHLEQEEDHLSDSSWTTFEEHEVSDASD